LIVKEGMIVAEIKSTLDLVLEKTRNMSLTPEEKERLEEEAARKRARGLFQKYVEGGHGLRDLEESLKRGGESNPEKTRRHVSLLMIESLGPHMVGTVNFEDLKAWLGPKAESEVDEAAKILHRYRQEISDLHEEIEGRLRMDLEQRGIRGGAVKPKVVQDQQWKIRSGELERETNLRLEKVKERLKQLL
jgi:hypothetical protein